MILILCPLSAQAEDVKTKALKAIESKQWDKAYTLAAQSNDPVVAKLYFWQYFQTDGNNGDFGRLAHFVKHNQNWPRINNIRRQLERKITPFTPDPEVIKWFDEFTPLTPTGLDYYGQALLRQGLEAKLRTVMGEWWATTLMSRDEQKEIYSKYKAYISLDAHRKRFDKLLLNGQYKNARAVASVLGNGYAELAEARIALADQSGNVNTLIAQVPANLQNDPGLFFERLRWRRKNGLDREAIEILHKAPAYERITNPKDWWQERHIIIRRMMEEGYYQQAYKLASGHVQQEGFAFAQAEWLAGWLALRFMDKPQEAYQRFETLHAKVSTPVSLARAAYWAGRAAEDMNATELAQSWYNKAAQFQTVYYGQEAGEKIGLEKAIRNAAPPPITIQQEAAFRQNEFYQAAQLYHNAGMGNRASEFLWVFASATDTAEAFRYAAEAAANMQRYHDVIKIAKEATQKGYFLTLQSYPTMPDKMRSANKGVEIALIHSLMRQESQFNTYAKSPAGALGLMQLMPATAQQVARKIGVGYDSSWLTQRPEYNIQLGSQYMAELLNRYDGEYIMAIAAYNAGPGRVDKWIELFGDPRESGADRMDWIELMPIYETRNYVQRVLEGLYVYRLLLHDKK